MKAIDLIGKNAIRTAPTYGDWSYTDTPILIINATNNHIIFKAIGRKAKIFGEEIRILNSRWCDDSWIDFDELIKK